MEQLTVRILSTTHSIHTTTMQSLLVPRIAPGSFRVGIMRCVQSKKIKAVRSVHESCLRLMRALEITRDSSASDQRASATLCDFCLLTCGNLCLFSYFNSPCCVLSQQFLLPPLLAFLV